MMWNKKIKSILKIALPVIFITYFCNITFFTHSHLINGVTIVHSHPYKTDANGNPDHSHTGIQIQLIHNLSVFFVAGSIIPVIILKMPEKTRASITTQYLFSACRKYKEPICRLRPPPAL